MLNLCDEISELLNNQLNHRRCLVKSTDAGDLGNTADANIREWSMTIQNLQKRVPDSAYFVPGHGARKNKVVLSHALLLLMK